MPYYYVNMNPQPSGQHEVHEINCTHGALPQNRRDLGQHNSCSTAVAQAKMYYRTADGCRYCSPSCNNG